MRKTARGQKLPPQEVEFLNSLAVDVDALIARVNALYVEGWSLQCIGESLNPPRPRTTIRSWVLRAASQEAIDSKVMDAPIPSPKLTEEGSKRPKKVSPGMSNATLENIRTLAPLARTFRAKMTSTAAPAVANQRLTDLCKDLYNNGVSIKELAAAAGVTYRAMYKRIKL